MVDKKQSKSRGSTRNGESTRSSSRRRRRESNPRRDDLNNKDMNDAIDDSLIDEIVDRIVEEIAQRTAIKTRRKLINPNSIGAAVAVASKSPVAGVLTSGGLSMMGKGLSGLGGLAGGLVESKFEKENNINMNNFGKDTKDNKDAWGILKQIIEQNKKMATKLDIGRLKEERDKLKKLENERELIKAESERKEILELILAELKGANKNDGKDKKSPLQRGLSWVLEHLLLMMGFRIAAGKLIPTAAITKGIMKVFNPIVIVTSIYSAIKGAVDGWIKRGNVEGIISGALGGLVELFTLGLIKSDKAEGNIHDFINWVTDQIGNLYFKVWESMKDLSITDMIKSMSTMAFEWSRNTLDSFGTWLSDSLSGEVEFWKNAFNQLGITQWVSNTINSASQLLKDIEFGILTILNSIQDRIISIANKIPGVELDKYKSASDSELENYQRLLDNEKQKILDKPLSKNFTQKDKMSALMDVNLRLGDLRRTKEIRDVDNKRFPEVNADFTQVLNPADPELAVTINSPAQAKNMNRIQNNIMNDELNNQQSYGPQLPNSTGSQINTAVNANSTTNWIAPISKRNNENTFMRTQDRNSPAGMR